LDDFNQAISLLDLMLKILPGQASEINPENSDSAVRNFLIVKNALPVSREGLTYPLGTWTLQESFTSQYSGKTFLLSGLLKRNAAVFNWATY